MTIPRRLVADRVAARLATVTNAVGYFGQVGRGLDGELGGDPAPKSKADLRVRPYFVLFPGGGSPGSEEDLADTYVDLEILFRISAVAGDMDDLLALIDRIDQCLRRWAPSPIATESGLVICGPLRPPPGYDPPVMTTENYTPPRHWIPLQYVLTAHT